MSTMSNGPLIFPPLLSRSYQPEKNGEYNDLAYYEGHFQSQIREAEQAEGLGRGQRAAATAGDEPDLDARNPLRAAARRLPAHTGRVGTALDDSD